MKKHLRCWRGGVGARDARNPSFAQQDKSKRPSPPETVKLHSGGGKAIKVDYSSPRMKGPQDFRQPGPQRPSLASRRE